MLSKRKLEKLYKSGLSMLQIAEKENWSYHAVRYWMEKYNIKRRPRDEACYYGYWTRHNNGKSIPPYKAGKRLTLEKVKDLYYKKGYSAREIGEFFGKSTSRIYDFMKKYGLPRRTPSESNNLVYLRQKPSFSLKKNLTRGEEKLKIAGIMLYWAEGYKNLGKKTRGGTIDLGNSDPKMIRLFLKFLRGICGVDENRLRVRLYCYANQNVDSIKKYWSKITGIPLKQFMRPYIREDFSPDKINKMKYGLAHIVYSDKKLFLQIKNWIEQYLNENID
jgi:transposase